MKKVIFVAILLTATQVMAETGKADTAMCNKAISESKGTLATYRETVKKNYDGGYITRANYDEAITKFDKIEKGLTMNECMNSSGHDLEIYQCLAKNYGDVMTCLK